MELGDKHQTTPREATNDPGNDNINALKNAHLTPRAIKAVQSGKDIKNEDSEDEGTTDGRKSAPKTSPSKTKTQPAAPVKRQQLATPKPVKKKNPSTTVSRPSKASAPRKSTSSPVTKSTSTKPKEKTSTGSTGTAYVTLLDMINAGVNT